MYVNSIGPWLVLVVAKNVLRGTPDALGLGTTRGSRHSQGLKPNSFSQRYGTAQAVP